MSDYLPLRIAQINRIPNKDSGEIRITATVSTIQPETFSLNLSKLDADRLQSFINAEGKILMVPVRRGEVNGRSFTSVGDGYIFPADNIQVAFGLKVGDKVVSSGDAKPISKPAAVA